MRVDTRLLCSPPLYPLEEGGVPVAWPPPMKEALEGCRDKGGEPLQPKQHPTRFIVLACSLAAEARTDADLMKAYQILANVSNFSTPDAARRFRVLKALCAINMVPVLVAMRARSCLVLAGMEVRAAYGSATELPGLTEALQSAEAYVQREMDGMKVCGRLEWAGAGRLEPQDDLARERLTWLPAHPLDGAWAGVRGILRNWGLDVKGRCGVEDPVRVERQDAGLSVAGWAA